MRDGKKRSANYSHDRRFAKLREVIGRFALLGLFTNGNTGKERKITMEIGYSS